MTNYNTIKELKELYNECDKFVLNYNGDECDIKVNEVFDNIVKFQYILDGKLSPENLQIDFDKINKIKLNNNILTLYI